MIACPSCGRRRNIGYSSLLLAVLLLGFTLPVSLASTGSWPHHEGSLIGTASSLYEIIYNVPDRIQTNETSAITVTMKVSQLNGTTYGVVTDHVEVKITASGGEYTNAVTDVKELRQGQTWGPIEIPITVVDKTFNMDPETAINAKVHLTLKIGERGHTCVFGSCLELLGSPFQVTISSDKDAQDINTVVQSTTKKPPTAFITDPLKKVIETFWPVLVLIFGGFFVVIYFYVGYGKKKGLEFGFGGGVGKG